MAVDNVRLQAGMAGGTYTKAATAGVRAMHITQLRTLGPITESYTDGALTGVVIKAVHFQQLRDRVK